MSRPSLRASIEVLDAMSPPELRAWPHLQQSIAAQPLLNGDSDGYDALTVKEAVAAVRAAPDADAVARLPLRTRLAAASVYWSNAHGLRDHPPYRDAVVIDLAVPRTARRLAPRLLRSTLEHWAVDDPHFWPMVRLVEGLPGNDRGWRAKAIGRGALEPDGPGRLGAELFAREDSAACFADWGMGPTLRAGAFAGAAFAHVCARVEAEPSLAGYRRLWSLALDSEQERRFSFPSVQETLVRACLRPWSTRRAPADIQSYLVEQLRNSFGDPRLAPHKWMQVDARDTAVFKRWLAKDSLSLFLDIVGKDAEARMWDYRRSFWEACFKRDLIDEAWVAFGPAGWQRLKLHRQRAFDRDLPAGQLQGASDRTQSVLLMTMGPFTLVEWSHNGQIWFLDSSTRKRPGLYRQFYQASDCRGFTDTIFNRSHNNPEGWRNGRGSCWQRETADIIHRLMNIRITRAESLPGRQHA